jgi:two-component system, LytTR family, sensor kinase
MQGFWDRLSFQYKKYIIHFLVVAVIFFVSSAPFIFFPPLKEDILQNRFLFITFSNLLVYVLNVLYFVPLLLSKKKFLAYFLSMFFCCVIMFLIRHQSEDILFIRKEIPPPHEKWERKLTLVFEHKIGHSKKERNRGDFGKPMASLSVIIPVLFTFAVGLSIEITAEWMKQEQSRKKTENEKLQAELSFLKSQINPHFLFNVLNNIYALASDKSDQTPHAILKLSNMMRYILYQSDIDRVSLSKEVQYLENYIALQMMRLSTGKVQVDFQVDGNISTHEIQPMLLIAFVENAFKHGVSYVQDSAIRIRLIAQNQQIFFEVKNLKVAEKDFLLEEETGIGLKNVKRRLDLLYPQKHILQIDDSPDLYQVQLTLQIDDHTLHSH